MVIKGKAIKVGDNINTDIISPPQYMELPIEEQSRYSMSAVYPDFADKTKANHILVAGKNLGSGSSRETAPLILKHLGIKIVIAEFFARIFYRNLINLGIIAIECPRAFMIHEDDELEADVEKGVLSNITKDESYECTKIPDHILVITNEGGLVNMLKKEFDK